MTADHSSYEDIAAARRGSQPELPATVAVTHAFESAENSA
jgi:hypothetical protein